MSELLWSKAFIPVYWIVGVLACVLFYSIGVTKVELVMLAGPCFLVGTLSFIQNCVTREK
ncbi:MAG TPA: hypothetical protein VIG60_03920 [Savagea sp.]